MDECRIGEVGTPEHFFRSPQNGRTKHFSNRFLHQVFSSDAGVAVGAA